MVKFTYYSLFFLIKSPENSFFQQDVRTGRNPEEVAAKMATAQGDSDVIFLRGGHLSCHLLRKAPRTSQSDFNNLTKTIAKGKCFGSPARRRDSLVLIIFGRKRARIIQNKMNQTRF